MHFDVVEVFMDEPKLCKEIYLFGYGFVHFGLSKLPPISSSLTTTLRSMYGDYNSGTFVFVAWVRDMVYNVFNSAESSSS